LALMFWPLFFLVAILGLAALRASLRVASVVLFASVLFYGAFGGSVSLFLLMAAIAIVVLVPLNVPALRQEWLSRPALAGFRRLLLTLNADTLAALEQSADSSSGWDDGLLEGHFDWAHFNALPAAQPSVTEQAQIEGLLSEFRQLCAADKPPQARLHWLQQRGLFGLTIDGLTIARPEPALALSPLAQSALIAGLTAIDPQATSRLNTAGRLIGIELLKQKGTPAQQSQWLPGLASGIEQIDRVCETPAGSAVAVRTQANGSSAIGLRLRLNAPVSQIGDSTLLMLTVQVQDPSGLLDRKLQGGLSCLLLPRRTAGLRATSALEGEALVIAEEAIVGGIARVGYAAFDLHAAAASAGAILPPAIHAGIAATAALAAGAYARSHAPFAEPVGEHATVQEALAIIGAGAYAAEVLAAGTTQTLAEGAAVLAPAAFARSFAVEQSRRIAAAAADIGLTDTTLYSVVDFAPAHSGCTMPARLARPIDHTACVLSGHTAFMAALAATREKNPARGLQDFDRAFWGHFGHLLNSGSRAFVLALSAGLLSAVQMRSPLARRIGQRINRYSAALAFAADIGLSRLGADLASSRSFTVRRNARKAARLTLTTWLGDALAQLWLATRAIKRFDDAGAPAADRAVLEWVCADAFRGVEEALDRVLRHLSSPILALITRLIIFPLGRGAWALSDTANRQVAQGLIDGRLLRAALLKAPPRLGPLAELLLATLDGEALESRVAAGPANGRVMRIEQALASGLIDAPQAQQLLDWIYAARALQRAPDATAS
jgi:acyl-CoA dehydrogenase